MRGKNVIALTLVLGLLSGCGSFYIPERPAEPLSPAQSQPPAAQTPALERVTANELVLRLLELESARNGGGNVILSPLSIEMALGMAANAAEGEARQALETLLGFTDVSQLNAGLGGCLDVLESAEAEHGKAGPLSIANSVWLNGRLEGLVNDNFKNTMAERYRAQQGLFTPYSEADAGSINAWVKEKTRGKIDSIVTADALSDDALAVLVNALYFDGRWADPFEDYQVRRGKFKALAGEQDAQLMSDVVGTYFETEYAKGFSKTYEDGYEFIGILPKEDGPVELDRLDVDAFLQSETGAYDVDILIPKFELEYSASLAETLAALGLGSIFDEGGMNGLLTDEAKTGGWEAHVSDVIHKTYMKMYEEGTEAAAVTGVVMVGCTAAVSAPRERRQVFLDRPFAFLIRDAYGQMVFCGVVNGVE